MPNPRRRAGDFDSQAETMEHIGIVRRLMFVVVTELVKRGEAHDASKLEEPEKSVFDQYTQKLRDTTFGSPEYEEYRAAMGPGLDHHYAVNDHHPEHFPPGEGHEVTCGDYTNYLPGGEQTLCRAWCSACDWSINGDPEDVRDRADSHEREYYNPGGIYSMNLMQITEMLCDWIAATRRHADGDIHESIEQQAARFGYGEEIERMLHLSANAILALEAV